MAGDAISELPEDRYTVEFASVRDYWRLVQNPATRSGDSKQLLEGAKSALAQFNHPHVVASALCVLVYRFLEIESLRPSIDVGDIMSKYRTAKDGLRDFKDLQCLRWYLSLNMAIANLQLHLEQSDLALETLRENVDRKDDALLLGQPFTNVVKSAAASMGIMKYRNPNRYTTQQVSELVGRFSALNGNLTANYRFGNQWVFEELALVFRTLYSIAKMDWLIKDSPAETPDHRFLDEFDDTSIPNSFLRLLKNRRG